MSESTFSPAVFTDPNRLAKIQKAIPALDQIYQDYATNNKIPGYCYAIVVDGKLLHIQAGGYANVSNKTPATPQTVFRLASLSKSFTAMAILKLRDDGKLQLDDPIYDYIPEMRNQKLTADSPVLTIRDLLIHASGLPQDDPWGDRKLSDTTAEFLDVIKAGLCFSNPTGTEYEYSNMGYTILGHVISQAASIPYQEYIAKNIWQPLGMKSATWEYSTVATQDLAHGYRCEDDQWIDEPILHDGAFASMGGIMVSVEDFSKYVALHQNSWPARNDAEDGPIARSTLRSMHRPRIFDQLNCNYKLLDGSELGFTKAYGYGLGWMQDSEAKSYVFHPGSLPGYHAHWNMLPDYGVAVIVMGNIKNAPRFDINMLALNTLVRMAELQPRTLTAAPVLLQRQQALVKLLPNWQDATNSGIFAPNFFLDNSLNKLQQQAQTLFATAGKIIHIGAMIAENQLRGSFVLEGEKAKLKVKFTLAPEKPALIQEYGIELLQ
jgi:CubicO group peptidase (beta-lactamase class C family)